MGVIFNGGAYCTPHALFLGLLRHRDVRMRLLLRRVTSYKACCTVGDDPV